MTDERTAGPIVVCTCPHDADVSDLPTVLIPLRSPSWGKTRLASHFSRRQRTALMTAMFGDVLEAVRAAGAVDPVLVTADAAGRDLAHRVGLRSVIDPPAASGLDDAIANACVRIDGSSVVVMADVPGLAGTDLMRLMRCRAQVSIIASPDGGTIALARRPSDAIPTAFGPDSARRHHDLAARAGLSCHLVRLSAPIRDFDTVADITSMTDTAAGPATVATLRRLRDERRVRPSQDRPE